jgi:hypothetical protein
VRLEIEGVVRLRKDSYKTLHHMRREKKTISDAAETVQLFVAGKDSTRYRNDLVTGRRQGKSPTVDKVRPSSV